MKTCWVDFNQCDDAGRFVAVVPHGTLRLGEPFVADDKEGMVARALVEDVRSGFDSRYDVAAFRIVRGK